MEKQEGILRVSGSSKLHINLLKQPREVVVEFLDEEIVPCNHHHHHEHHHHHVDRLNWRLAYKTVRMSFFFHCKEFILELDWNVESVRTIKWVVTY